MGWPFVVPEGPFCMTWVQLDDLFPEHPKVVNAGPLARALYVDALCYASRYLTDGRLSDAIARRMARDYADYATPDQLIDALVDNGLWDRVEDGFEIHDYGFWIMPTGAVRVRDRPGQSVWSAIRMTVFRRDDFTCRYCGKRGVVLECDHVVPVSRGGSHDDTNLVTACVRCNRSKGSKLPEEWRR